MCETSGMTKESLTEMMIDNIHDFYLFIDHNKISCMFLERMRINCKIMTSKEIPDFFLNSCHRQALTSTSISPFEVSVVKKCINSMY